MPKVYYVPKKLAQSIRTPVHMISINDPYGSWAEFNVNHNMLKLGFINHYSGIQEHSLQHLIQEEQIQRIMDFVAPIMAKGEDIIVHCGEGSVRSPAIAQFIHHISEHAQGVPVYMPSGRYQGHDGSDHHTCRHTVRACTYYHSKKMMEGKTPIDGDEVVKLCEAAGVEYRTLYAQVDWFRVEEGRRFIKEDVEAALAKIATAREGMSGLEKALLREGGVFAKPALDHAGSIMMENMRNAHGKLSTSAELAEELNKSASNDLAEALVTSAEEIAKVSEDVPPLHVRPAMDRIRPRDPDLTLISESTIDSSDPYSPEFQRALAHERAEMNSDKPRVIVKGVRDESTCTGKGCDVCKKDKQ